MGKGFYSDGRPWPRLSQTLTGPKCHGTCQRCGSMQEVSCWAECGDDDQGDGVVVFLCDPCGQKIIEPHPRLYIDGLSMNRPAPGAMACCRQCSHRWDLSCRHPELKANGGAGLRIQFSLPTHVHVDGRTKGGKRFGRWYQEFAHSPTCAGRDALSLPPPDFAEAGMASMEKRTQEEAM